MDPVQSITLGIAALFLIANALIATCAWQQNMIGHAVVFYVLMAIGVAVLPTGGPMWFLLIIFVSTALRSGRLLVKSQRSVASEDAQ